jgi:hypothetical protein
MSFFDILYNVALSEEILKLRGFTQASPLKDGEPFQLRWEALNQDRAVIEKLKANEGNAKAAVRKQIGNMRPPRGSFKEIE